MDPDPKTNVASETNSIGTQIISNKALTLFYTTLAYLILRKEMI